MTKGWYAGIPLVWSLTFSVALFSVESYMVAADFIKQSETNLRVFGAQRLGYELTSTSLVRMVIPMTGAMFLSWFAVLLVAAEYLRIRKTDLALYSMKKQLFNNSVRTISMIYPVLVCIGLFVAIISARYLAATDARLTSLEVTDYVSAILKVVFYSAPLFLTAYLQTRSHFRWSQPFAVAVICLIAIFINRAAIISLDIGVSIIFPGY